MSLLSVTVKKARYFGAQAAQFNTYVTLKLQNVKSTTVTVKGATPCWEQDFLFETNDINTGLQIEVWSKGMIWDRAMGYSWVPLQIIQYANEEGNGRWLSLDAELVMRDGEVVGTKSPTGHSLLVDCRFELPFDSENAESGDLQRKLEMLNSIADQEARAEQVRRQMQYLGHSGYSEDSDYTSDLNYPVGQHPNSSASQFRSAAHQMYSPQRSLETSRENSYEKDDINNVHDYMPPPYTHHLNPNHYPQHHRTTINQKHYPNHTVDDPYTSPTYLANEIKSEDLNLDLDPLFYNSRPPNYYKQKQSSVGDGYNTNYYYNNHCTDIDYVQQESWKHNRPGSKNRVGRRASLERQASLYDDSTLYNSGKENIPIISYMEMRTQSIIEDNDEKFYDACEITFHNERFGENEEDYAWDIDGSYHKRNITKKLPHVPSVKNYLNKKRSCLSVQDSNCSFDDCLGSSENKTRRKMPQIPVRQNSLNEQESIGYDSFQNVSHRGASLPPTPTKTPKVLIRVAGGTKPFNSLPATPGRKLPQVNHQNAKSKRNMLKRTNSAECGNYSTEEIYKNYMRSGAISAREMYNENYNYAYQSTDNLPDEQEETNINSVIDNDYGMNKVTSHSKPLTFYQESSEEQYYEAQDNIRDEYYEGNTSEFKLNLNNRGSVSLVPQNNNSLELDLYMDSKEQFPIATSENNSFNEQVPLSYSYYNEPSNAFTSTNSVSTAAQVSQSNSSNDGNVHYSRDQSKTVEVLRTVTSILPNVLKNEANNVINSLTSSSNFTSYGKKEPTPFLQHDKGVDKTGFNKSVLADVVYPEKIIEEPYLEHQESVESYLEKDLDISADYTKAAKKGSFDIGMGVHKSNQSIDSSHDQHMDPYHPSMQQNSLEPYASGLRRESIIDDYRSPSPVERSSVDIYQENDYKSPEEFEQDNYELDVTNRGAVLPPSNHAHEYVESVLEDECQPLEDDHLTHRHSLLEQLEEESPSARPQVTAQQRWHWAYNKIIMQLNVSTIIYYLVLEKWF